MRNIQCTFKLNSQKYSMFYCPGLGFLPAYSGDRAGRDNPAYTAATDVGPIPPGTYYIVDRQSGGWLGWLHNFANAHVFDNTNPTTWSMLWNATSGDTTYVDGIKRGRFRLHPDGIYHMSEGGIAILNPPDFVKLAKFLRAAPPDMVVPGFPLRAYGMVTVT